MKQLVFLISLMMLVGIAYADDPDEVYFDVSFVQTAPDNQITWTNENLNNVDVDQDVSYSTSTDRSTRTYDVGRTRYRETTTTSTTTQTTETTTTTTTQTAVDLTVTFWDMVDAQGALNSEEDFENSWSTAWTQVDRSSASQTNRTFQIRRDSKEKIEEAADELNGMYSRLFDLQNQISGLYTQGQQYETTPDYDKQHPNYMDKLAKLRAQEYALKGEIKTKRGEVFDTQGSDVLGWTVNTTVQTDIDTTITDITTTVNTVVAESNICFVASTQANGSTIEQLWNENKSMYVIANNVCQIGQIARTGYYTGMVYMFYDASGNPLLPGSVTANHGMVLQGIVKRADMIQAGDKLILGSNETVTIARIESTHYQGYVYNISNGNTPFSFTDTNYLMTLGSK